MDIQCSGSVPALLFLVCLGYTLRATNHYLYPIPKDDLIDLWSS